MVRRIERIMLTVLDLNCAAVEVLPSPTMFRRGFHENLSRDRWVRP